MKATVKLQFPISGLPERLEVDGSKLTFGLYLQHYTVFSEMATDGGSPFKDTDHILRWYAAMEAFTLACTTLDRLELDLLKTPDRNSLNAVISKWLVFDETKLAQSYIEHGYESFPLQVPITSSQGNIDTLAIEVPTVATSMNYDKAKNQLDKDWVIFRGTTNLTDTQIRSLSMPDYMQAKMRAYDFLSQTGDYFPPPMSSKP